MTETPEHRLKRLKIRSWRRGTKEMDLILGSFADKNLTTLDAGTLDSFEDLLEENDQDLYPWFSGQQPTPEKHSEIMRLIRNNFDFR